MTTTRRRSSSLTDANRWTGTGLGVASASGWTFAHEWLELLPQGTEDVFMGNEFTCCWISGLWQSGKCLYTSAVSVGLLRFLPEQVLYLQHGCQLQDVFLELAALHCVLLGELRVGFRKALGLLQAEGWVRLGLPAAPTQLAATAASANIWYTET